MPKKHLAVLKAYVLDRVADGLPVEEKFYNAIANASVKK